MNPNVNGAAVYCPASHFIYPRGYCSDDETPSLVYQIGDFVNVSWTYYTQPELTLQCYPWDDIDPTVSPPTTVASPYNGEDTFSRIGRPTDSHIR